MLFVCSHKNKIVAAFPEVNKDLHNIQYFNSDLISVILEICNALVLKMLKFYYRKLIKVECAKQVR